MKSIVLVSSLIMSVAAHADLAADVRCREIAFSQAAESQNAELFSSFIDSDARFVSNSVDRGPAPITEAWGMFFAKDGPSIKWRPQFVEVLEDGMLALSRGPYRMITRDEAGNESEHWGTFNSVWRLNADGQWRVVFDAGSGATETPDDEVKALLDQPEDCDG